MERKRKKKEEWLSLIHTKTIQKATACIVETQQRAYVWASSNVNRRYNNGDEIRVKKSHLSRHRLQKKLPRWWYGFVHIAQKPIEDLDNTIWQPNEYIYSLSYLPDKLKELFIFRIENDDVVLDHPLKNCTKMQGTWVEKIKTNQPIFALNWWKSAFSILQS